MYCANLLIIIINFSLIAAQTNTQNKIPSSPKKPIPKITSKNNNLTTPKKPPVTLPPTSTLPTTTTTQDPNKISSYIIYIVFYIVNFLS